jgi:uncharacterized protein DUF4365
MARHRPSKKARPPKRSAEKKTLSSYGPQGQRGIHLIGDIVGEMRSRFDPTQATEVGLDGYIEMFDPHTGHPKNVTLAVQSKTVDALEGDDRVVRYTCERKDIEYWLDCDLPVLLIVSRPSTCEAYWLHVQAFFNDPENEGTTVTRISERNRCFGSRPGSGGGLAADSEEGRRSHRVSCIMKHGAGSESGRRYTTRHAGRRGIVAGSISRRQTGGLVERVRGWGAWWAGLGAQEWYGWLRPPGARRGCACCRRRCCRPEHRPRIRA